MAGAFPRPAFSGKAFASLMRGLPAGLAVMGKKCRFRRSLPKVCYQDRSRLADLRRISFLQRQGALASQAGQAHGWAWPAMAQRVQSWPGRPPICAAALQAWGHGHHGRDGGHGCLQGWPGGGPAARGGHGQKMPSSQAPAQGALSFFKLFSSGAQKSSLLPMARVSKRVRGLRKASLTVPVGPLRCLPMMISATPGSRESLL